MEISFQTTDCPKTIRFACDLRWGSNTLVMQIFLQASGFVSLHALAKWAKVYAPFYILKICFVKKAGLSNDAMTVKT